MNETVSQWIKRHAHPLTTPAPQAPLDDLLPLRDMAADAAIVAVGASTRQAYELSAIAHRILRFLVEELGFRSLALEGDDPGRVGLDAYVRTGRGDPRAALAEARPFWRTEEILGVVSWMRAYNERHPHDQVRFAELPESSRQAPPPPSREDLEKRLADDVIWWRGRTGDKIVYWGGIAHTVVSPGSLGGHLRERFGPAYLSVGLTFEDGSLPGPVPAPPADFAETLLSTTDMDAFFLDLRAARPDPVRAWLETPARTRLVGPAQDPTAHLSGGSFGDWFDVVAHHRRVTPVHLISQ
ncbi:erythromycin esterase family protein [Nonomuraea sp. NPDC005983]|uniref:erythromycin esterase family protein n=1 Tax=Nonomuraea sp. NPDC005983 TaxID=3155595 RepID=UPI00339F52E4